MWPRLADDCGTWGRWPYRVRCPGHSVLKLQTKNVSNRWLLLGWSRQTTYYPTQLGLSSWNVFLELPLELDCHRIRYSWEEARDRHASIPFSLASLKVWSARSLTRNWNFLSQKKPAQETGATQKLTSCGESLIRLWNKSKYESKRCVVIQEVPAGDKSYSYVSKTKAYWLINKGTLCNVKWIICLVIWALPLIEYNVYNNDPTAMGK